MKSKILILILIISTFTPVYYSEAGETQIFYDDFESGIGNWDLQSGWSVILEKGNHILEGSQHTFATADLEGVANKLELKLKLFKGTIHLNIRSKFVPGGLNRYFIGLNGQSSNIQKQLGDDFYYLKDGKGISLDEWHNIKIEMAQDRINVFSDGNLLFSIQDKDLIKEGGISFETLENSLAYIDNVKVEMLIPEARVIKSDDLFSRGEHKSDIVLSGQDLLVLENGKFIQFGNIYLKDRAKLIIRNSELKISRYQKLLNHWWIELKDTASLEIENSRILPEQKDGPTLVVVRAEGRARIKMINSPTQIHLFIVEGSGRALVERSEIVGEIGGLVVAGDRGEVKISDSKIGAVNLSIPAGAVFEATDLGTGFFKDWNLQRDTKVSGINYNIILQNTEILPDRLGPGPYERGFPVFIDSSAKVKIKDSQLRKVVIELHDEKAEFSSFVVEKPTNFNYREISLENVKVMGQWGIFPHGSSEIVVRDSEAFWTFIYDDSKLTLINTHLNEFDPRNFRGQILFENSHWDTAAEIVINNDFVISGSLEIGQIGGFSWNDSKVRRIYEVNGKPNSELTLTKNGKTIWSGIASPEGKASFSIEFDDKTFDDSWLIQDNTGKKKEVTFFSKTPIEMEQTIISELVQKIKSKRPPGSFRLFISVLLFRGKSIIFLAGSAIFIIFIFVILKKFLRKRRRE